MTRKPYGSEGLVISAFLRQIIDQNAYRYAYIFGKKTLIYLD